MQKLKSGFVWAFALAAGLILAPTTQATPLASADLNTPGDNLLTVDSDTGLEFLDPGATRQVSYNDTLQTPFVTQQGFRFATVDEFRGLLTAAGFSNFSGNFNTADEPATENLLNNFLGETIPPGQPFNLDAPGTQFDAEISDGFYSYALTPDTPPGLVNVVGVDYQSAALGQSSQDQTRVLLSLNQLPPDTPAPIAGGLLVRQSATTVSDVPEPSSLGLMALGLMMVAAVGFRPFKQGMTH